MIDKLGIKMNESWPSRMVLYLLSKEPLARYLLETNVVPKVTSNICVPAALL